MISASRMQYICAQLIEQSISFRIDPLPKGMFEIAIKPEASEKLNALISTDHNLRTTTVRKSGFKVTMNGDEDGRLSLTIDHKDGSTVERLGFDIANSENQWADRFTTDRIEGSELDDAHADDMLVTNHYTHCGQDWSVDDCDSFHNDRYPVCDREIEPHQSTEYTCDGTKEHYHSVEPEGD